MVELGIDPGPLGLGGLGAAKARSAADDAKAVAWAAADAFEFAPAADPDGAVPRPTGSASGPSLSDAAGPLQAMRAARLDGGPGLVETLTADHVVGYEPPGPTAPSDRVGAPLADAAVPRGAPDAARAEAAARQLDTYTSGKGGLGVESDFNVTIVFAPGMPDELREEFILAAEYLSTIITGGLRNQGRIDDIVIVAQVSDIDGEGGILGQAGPLGLRSGSFLPTTGIMQFDEADAAQLDADGQFDEVVVHEMMHCLGFGTTWEQMGLLEGSIRKDDLRFVGENATLAYPEGKPGAYAKDPDADEGVPVETDYGPGTAGGHWDEELFRQDLMTGFIDPKTGVSAVTVAAFEDMGYETVWDPRKPGAAMPQPDDLVLVG